MSYNFYAKPKNDEDLIIVASNATIHALRFILIDKGKYSIFDDKLSTYKLVNEPLVEDCLVEDHHCYKVLTLGWTINGKEGWYDEDKIPFSIILTADYLIKCIKEFYNKPFNKDEFVNKLNTDDKFKHIVEAILGNDIDYVDMYFNRNQNWSLTKLEVKEIRTITYKNSNQ